MEASKVSMETVGSIISEYRKKRGLSQRELARDISVAASYLNEIENNQCNAPSEKIIKKLARGLNINLEVLYDARACEKSQLPPDLVKHVRQNPESLILLRSIAKAGMSKPQISKLIKQVQRQSVKAIILAAGKGTRMKHMTESLPKCLAIELEGMSLLQTQVATLRSCGISEIVVVRGYQGRKIKSEGLRYVWNKDYDRNNILESLMCAYDELEGDVIVSYSDIWYEQSVLQGLLRSDNDIAIGVDVDWRDYYEGRKDHPIQEAENVIFDSENKIIKIGKIGASESEVHGEFIGMIKLTSRGCQIFTEFYRRAKRLYGGKPYQRAREFRHAYLTDILQDMADAGIPIHCQIIGSKWKEIDTLEDFKNAKIVMSQKRKKDSFYVQLM